MSGESQPPVQVLFPSPSKVDGSGEPIAVDVEPTMTIAPDHVKIGDVVLPGIWIERGGVVVRPGIVEVSTDDYSGGSREIREGATVTITFLVGDIVLDEAATEHVILHQRMDFALGLERPLTPIDGTNADTGVLDASLDPEHPVAKAAADDSWDVLRGGS